MIETMHEMRGVGLAAVQVGEMVNLVLVELPEDEEDPQSGKLHVVLNPEIVKTSNQMEVGIEGCLSIPGYIGEVERSTFVVVRGLDRHGKKIKIRARDYLARVFQHEVDHLQGTLYIDRLVAPDRIWPVEEGEEEQAEAEAESARAEAPQPIESSG
jgi:peptide deformylase